MIHFLSQLDPMGVDDDGRRGDRLRGVGRGARRAAAGSNDVPPAVPRLPTAKPLRRGWLDSSRAATRPRRSRPPRARPTDELDQSSSRPAVDRPRRRTAPARARPRRRAAWLRPSGPLPRNSTAWAATTSSMRHDALAQTGHVGQAARAERQHGCAIGDALDAGTAGQPARDRLREQARLGGHRLADDRVDAEAALGRPRRGSETRRQARPGRLEQLLDTFGSARQKRHPGPPGRVECGRQRQRLAVGHRDHPVLVGHDQRLPCAAFNSTASRRST